MKYILHFHRNGREQTSEHPSVEDAVLAAVAGEMDEALSIDYLSDDQGNVVLDEDALHEAVWGWEADHS
jgi:hypothetical protein